MGGLEVWGLRRIVMSSQRSKLCTRGRTSTPIQSSPDAEGEGKGRGGGSSAACVGEGVSGVTVTGKLHRASVGFDLYSSYGSYGG